MNRDEVIRMALEAGAGEWGDSVIPAMMDIERFAALVAEAEAAKWAKGAKVSVTTDAMEQQFAVYHRRGYEAGKALIPAAVAAEREACAQLCDEFGEEYMCDSAELGKLIRARGQK